MLVQFSVKNWRSIKSEQTLSMVMDKGKELVETNTFDSNAPATGHLLNSLVIFGPNGAGKSNLISAIQFVEKTVLDSATKTQSGDTLDAVPFLLDSDYSSNPTEFEVVFVEENVRYQYGFSLNSQRILDEWLIAYPVGRPQRWLTREWSDDKNNYNWDWKGEGNASQKDLWIKSTRENALFLSTAIQLNNQQLAPVYNWFRRRVHVTLNGWTDTYTAKQCLKKIELKKTILDLLKAADIEIDDIVVESIKFTEKHFKDVPEEIRNHLLEEIKNQEYFKVNTVHTSAQGTPVSFDLEHESTGTRKIFAFAGPFINALQNGYILIIDELHNSLHPKALQFLIKLFHDKNTNPKNAQLIFTTHETAALTDEIFRRDQIWFCEKDDDKSTVLYPLTDFSPRKGRENFEAAYLDGRYGALPFLRKFSLIDEGENGV